MTQNDIARRLAKDFYEELGLQSPSSPEDIKKQFRLLALKYHPDKNKDDQTAEAKFKAVNEAYAILGDEQNKKMYDEMRMMLSNGMTSHHAHMQQPGAQTVYNNGVHMQPQQQMHGGGIHTQPVHNGWMHQGDTQTQNYHHHPTPHQQCGHGCACCNQNYHYTSQGHFQNQTQGHWGASVVYEAPVVDQAPVLFNVGVTLEEILTGAIKHVQVSRSFLNPYTSMLLQEDRNIMVSVPRGVHQGQMVGWSREGEGNGFAASHFIFIVNQLPHPLFLREGDDVVLRIAEESIAKEKEKIMVETLESDAIEIELSLLRSEVLVVKGKGLPRFDQPDVRGDFIVELEGPPPKSPTLGPPPEQKS